MLDTNICIYMIKQKPRQVIEKLKSMNKADLCISSITYSELLYGAEKSSNIAKNLLALTMFLSNIEILPYDENASVDYGFIRSDLEKKGKPIGPLDMLIAAHAASLRMILVTNNEKEFERVKGLNIENWTK
jgi:tRNA(fMet)-specific endonuclease VapC